MPPRILPFLIILSTFLWNPSILRAKDTKPETLTTEAEWSSNNILALSPNGKWLLTNNLYHAVALWDAQTGKRMFCFPQQGSVTGAAFSPDSTLFATCNAAGRAGLWNVQTGQLVEQLPHSAAVASLAFSPDGRTLVTAIAKHVFLWDGRTGSRRATLDADIDNFGFLAISPDSRWLATGRYTKAVQLWDLAAGHLSTTLDVGNNVNTFAFSPDSQFLAVGGGNNFVGANSRKLQLWDVNTGLKQADLPVTEVVEAVAFSHNGKTLAAGNALWDTATGKLKMPLEAKYRNANIDEWVHISDPDGIGFSPDDRTLAGKSQRVFAWNTETGKLTTNLSAGPGVTDDFDSVIFSSDGSLAAASSNRQVRLWDTRTGTLKGTFVGLWNRVQNMQFSPDGSMLAVAGDDNSVHLWNTHTGMQQAALTGNTVDCYAISPNGNILATGSEDCKVRLWWLADGHLLRTLSGHQGAISSVAFSPDSTSLATASLDKTARLWNVVTGASEAALTGSTAAATNLIFSPDGTTLALDTHSSPDGFGNSTTGLWNVRTRTRRAVLKLSGQDAFPTCFSPDSTILVTTGGFWTPAEIWDVRTGHPKFDSHELPTLTSVSTVGFSPDGKLLGVAGWTNVGGEGQPDIVDHFYVLRSSDGTLVPWKQPAQLNLFHDVAGIDGLVFSPNGRLAAAVSEGNKVLLWKKDGTLIATLNNAGGPIAFSANGLFLMARSGTKAVIWDIRAGKPVPAITPALSAMFPAFLNSRVTLAGPIISLWNPVTGKLVRTLDAEGKM